MVVLTSGGVSLDTPLKYNRQKLSATRDFPKGCGRSKPSEKYPVLVGCTESLKAGALNSQKALTSETEEALNEGEAVKAMETLKPLVMENMMVLDHKELVRPSKTLEPESTNSSKNMNQMELLKSKKYSNGFECYYVVKNTSQLEEMDQPQTSETEEAMNEGETVKAMETLKPLVMENMMVLDQKELVRPSKTLEPESTNSSKNMNQMELLKSKKYSNGFECYYVVKNTSQLEEMDQPQTSICDLWSIHKGYAPRSRISASRDFPPGCCTRIATSRDSPGCCTRIAASRDFPPGCGRKALELGKEKRLKLIDSSKNQSSENEKSRGDNRQLEQMVMVDTEKVRENLQDGDAFKNFSGENRQLEKMVKDDAEKISWKIKDEGTFKSKLKEDAMKESMDNAQVKSGQDVVKAMPEHVQVQAASHSKSKKEDTEENNSVRPASTSNLVRSETKSPLMSKNIKREPAHSEKEFVELTKDNSFKRKLPWNSEDESCSLNQSQGEECTGLGPYCNREIVQALMAAPSCPWRQEEEVFKSPPPRGLVGGKRKKNDAHVNSEFLLIKKDGSGSLEVKSTKRKMPPVKDAYQSIDNQLVLWDEYDSPGHDEGDENFALVPRSQARSSSLIPFGFHTIVDKDDTEAVITRNKIRETLRLFQAISRKLLRDEEAKPKEKGYNGKRIDIISADILKEKNKWVNTGKQILGLVPGVEVGDEFHYRVELAIIGLHRQYQGGIDYLRKGRRTLATSIVFSGRYDDIDCSEASDVLVYSGQGGNPGSRDKPAEDQRLERGNLALKNSMDESSPVRVIRGFKEKADARGKIVATYTYDGLYLVEKFWQEKGRHGNNVFKFQLRRIQGQPELALKEVAKSKKLRVREGLCVVDISRRKEKMPICAVNTIDNEKPPLFKYITSMIYPSWYNPTPPNGCECTNGCSDSEECFCAVKNGGEIPFNYDGAMVFAKPLVYECGPSCKCPPSCHNRVSQHGIKFQLEIFKTESTGWGVRSLTSIPSGSFVCEYAGELLEDKEAEQRTGSDEYLFDIGKNYNDRTLWEGLSNLMPPDWQSSISCDTVEDGGFTIDALKYGNVGRFINHSCSPNLYAQNVLYDHDDKRIPHIMLFAAENIPPLQELTYDYNYKIDQVLDSNGNIKKKECSCGSDACTGRLY